MVTKIIHTADLHLDSRLSSLPDSEKSRIKRAELLDGFCRLADYAVKNNVAAMLIAGDLFEGHTVSPKVKKEVLSVFQKNPGVTFFILGGNHDSDAFDANFLLSLPSNVKTFNDELTVHKLGGINVYGMETSAKFDASCLPVFNRDEINIVMLHGALVRSGNASAAEVNININKCAGKNIDYLALGHYHSYSAAEIDKRGIACYCGCLQGRGFDECGQKGFVLIETDGKKLSHKFVPFDGHKFNEVSVDVTVCGVFSALLGTVEEKLKDIPASEAVKITLAGNVGEENCIDVLRLTEAFKDKFFFVKAVDKTKIIFGGAADQNDFTLKSEFKKIVSALDVDDEQKNDILRYGFAALRGETDTL